MRNFFHYVGKFFSCLRLSQKRSVFYFRIVLFVNMIKKQKLTCGEIITKLNGTIKKSEEAEKGNRIVIINAVSRRSVQRVAKAHFRGLAPAQNSSKVTSQGRRAVGDTVTSSGVEPIPPARIALCYQLS